jgi:hypothetical protein
LGSQIRETRTFGFAVEIGGPGAETAPGLRVSTHVYAAWRAVVARVRRSAAEQRRYDGLEHLRPMGPSAIIRLS